MWGSFTLALQLRVRWSTVSNVVVFSLAEVESKYRIRVNKCIFHSDKCNKGLITHFSTSVGEQMIQWQEVHYTRLACIMALYACHI